MQAKRLCALLLCGCGVSGEVENQAYVLVLGVDRADDGQLELTSSMSSDQKEMNWLVSGLDLQDGWNELKLDLYAPDNVAGDFDYAKINFFRLYMFTEGTLKLNLDYIGFGYEDDDFGYDLPAYLVVSEDAPVLTRE